MHSFIHSTRWGMDDDKLQTVFINDLATLNELLVDETKELHDFHIINDTFLMVTWKYREEFAVGGLKTNIFIAAFTTCWARLKLYQEMEKLGHQLYYVDTDSALFSWKPSEYEPQLGDYLGDFTDELSCKNVGCKGCSQQHHIVEYYSAGPKNYCYLCDNGYVACKVRGFSLHGKNAQVINFDTMKELVTAPQNSNMAYIIEEPSKITRMKNQSVIYNRAVSKTYRMTYDKRVLLDNYDTLPYGY